MSSVNRYSASGDRVYSDRFGNVIRLSSGSEEHIGESHPETSEVYEAIFSTPDLLVKSTKHPRSVEYYKIRDSGNWHKVVLKKTESGIYISTSHYASRLSRGEWLWRNPEYEPTSKDLERNSGTEPPNDSPKIWPDGITLE